MALCLVRTLRLAAVGRCGGGGGGGEDKGEEDKDADEEDAGDLSEQERQALVQHYLALRGNFTKAVRGARSRDARHGAGAAVAAAVT